MQHKVNIFFSHTAETIVALPKRKLDVCILQTCNQHLVLGHRLWDLGSGTHTVHTHTLSMISVTHWLFAIGAFLIDTTTIDAFFCFLSTDSADKHCCAFDRKHEYNDHNDHDKR